MKYQGSALAGFRLRKNFDFQSSFDLWPAAARKFDVDLTKLGAGKEFKLDAVYMDWDESESIVESVDVVTVGVAD